MATGQSEHSPLYYWRLVKRKCGSDLRFDQFDVYFILVKRRFQEHYNELFVKWEISFPAAAL